MQGSSEAGWATRTLNDSVQQAEAAGIGFWQLVLIYSLFCSDVSTSRWPLLAAHLVLLAIACLLAWRRSAAWPLLPLVYAVLLLDYHAVADSGSALWFTCYWTSLIFTGVPFILLPVKRAVWFSLLALCATVGALIGWHGAWGTGALLVAVGAATGLAMTMVAMMRSARSRAAESDEQEASAISERSRLDLRRTVTRAAAEEARVMHDTLINTLSLIAGGSSVIAADTAAVRERCAHDAEVVEAILRGQHFHRPEGFRSAMTGVPGSIALRRSGLSDDRVDYLLATLQAEVACAVHGVVAELVRNAVKHSGAEEVVVDAHIQAGRLVITVADEGCGFDGRLIFGRGLAESVLSRSRAVDIDVAIVTVPDEGTVVTLTIPLEVAVPSNDPPDGSAATGPVVDMLQRNVGWWFAATTVCFGLLDLVINRPPRPVAAAAALVVIAVVSWLAMRSCRDGRTLAGWVTVVMLAAIPLCLLTSLYSIEFGRSEITRWSIVELVALPVIMLITRRARTAFFLGIGLLVVTAAVTTVVLWRENAAAAAVIPAGVATQLAILSAWSVMRHVMNAIGMHHQKTMRELADGRLEEAARDRIRQTRARWTAVAARVSVDVLRRIASGEVDAADRQVQHDCRTAERYLRQVLLLHPDMVHMSPWIIRALAEARSKSIDLILQPGEVDAATEEVAEVFGAVLLAGIEASASGAELSLGLYPGEYGPHMLVVGAGGSLRAVTKQMNRLPDPYTLSFHQFDDQDVLELAVVRDCVSAERQGRSRSDALGFTERRKGSTPTMSAGRIGR